jgi:U3 small nucleolar ribonucleoprotein component
MTTEHEQNTPTPFEKFLAFTKKVVAVPKSEIDKQEKQYQAERRKLKAKRSKA